MPESERSVPEVARRMRALRMATAGDSQADFCRRVGIAQNTWNQYEKGRGRPNLETAALLRDKLGVTLDWVYLADSSGLPTRLVQEIAKHII